jgi:hypothetical protein
MLKQTPCREKKHAPPAQNKLPQFQNETITAMPNLHSLNSSPSIPPMQIQTTSYYKSHPHMGQTAKSSMLSSLFNPKLA